MSNLLIVIALIVLALVLLLRQHYGEPPCIETRLIPTVTPSYSDSPLAKIQEDAVSFIHHRQSDGSNLYFYTDSNTTEKYSEKNCFPCSEVDELTYYKCQWKKHWQQILLKSHSQGNEHYLFPEKWITKRVKKIVNVQYI